MDDITQLLHTNFLKNMAFLKANFEELYLQIENFSQDISNGKMKENYSLEIVNGYFDILNLNENSYFYAEDSYEQASLIANHINFTKDGSLDLLRKVPKTNKLIFNEHYYEMLPIINFINENVDLNNIEFKKIYKFIYIGTGLGFHLQEIDKKINSYVTLIIEPNLEIFRLSLFTTDYTVFAQGNRSLYLSIGDSKLQRTNSLGNFSAIHDYMNYNIKYYNFLQSTIFIKEEIKQFFGVYSITDFPYKAIIQVFGRTLHYMKKETKFISLPKSHNKAILKDKKILIISAGPSLDNYIDWIKEHQNKFIIVCVDVITRKLEKNGIVPDIVFSIDASEKCADFLNTEDPNYLNSSVLFFLSQQHIDTYELTKDKNIYFSQGLLLNEKLGYFGSSPNVGTFSFVATVLLEANELYLIGCDAAFNQSTGERYASDSSHFIKDKQEEIKETKVFDRDTVITVKGNLRDEIKTNNDLLGFRSDYERTIYALSDAFNFKAYNLSDGAFIHGLEPLSKEELSKRVDSFEDKNHDLIARFDSISEVLTEEDLDYTESIKIMNEIIQLTQEFKKLNFRNEDEFLDKKLELTSEILKKLNSEKEYVFASIFLKFIALADIYINFILNLKQKDITSKSNLKKIGKYWSQAVIDVFKHILNIIDEA